MENEGGNNKNKNKNKQKKMTKNGERKIMKKTGGDKMRRDKTDWDIED